MRMEHIEPAASGYRHVLALGPWFSLSQCETNFFQRSAVIIPSFGLALWILMPEGQSIINTLAAIHKEYVFQALKAHTYSTISTRGCCLFLVGFLSNIIFLKSNLRNTMDSPSPQAEIKSIRNADEALLARLGYKQGKCAR